MQPRREIKDGGDRQSRLPRSLLVWRRGRVTEAKKKGIIWSVGEMSAQMNLDGQKQFARDLEIQKLSPMSTYLHDDCFELFMVNRRLKGSWGEERRRRR